MMFALAALAPLFAPQPFGTLAEPAAGSPLHSLQEDQRIERTFTVTTEMKLLESRQGAAGERSPGQAHEGVTRTSKTQHNLSFEDRIVAPGAEHPSEFVRAYIAADGNTALKSLIPADREFGTPAERINHKSKLTSPLAGKSVRFKLEGDRYARAVEKGGRLKAKVLDGLAPDLTFGFFAPPKNAKRGKSWELSGDHLSQLLNPGGDVPYSEATPLEDVMRTAFMMSTAAHSPEGEWEGGFKLIHKGSKKIKGRRVATLQIEVETTMTSSSTWDPKGGSTELPPGPAMGADLALSMEQRYTGKGVLQFDEELRQVVRLELELDVHESLSETASMPVPGMGNIDLESSETSEGTVIIMASTKVH